MPTSLLWFRRDLRLSDHPALLAAVDAAGADGAVVPVFVLDPRLWSPPAHPRRQFLRDCLAALQESMDGALVVRSGDPRDASSRRLVREVGRTACTSPPTPDPTDGAATTPSSRRWATCR